MHLVDTLFFAVLFVGTRLDLQVPLHRGHVYLRPLISTREESLEGILAEEMFFEHDRRSLAAWNVPNVDLADSIRERNFSSCFSRVNQSYFPIGVVLPMPNEVDSRNRTHCSNRWFRITSKEEHSNDAGYIVRLDLKDILHVLKARLRRCKGSLGVLPETSTIQRLHRIVLSSDWTRSIIDRMVHFSSILVTLRGVSGSGKTHSALFLSTIASFYFHRPMFYLDCKNLQKSKSRMSGVLEEIDSLFTRAHDARHSIIVLDDLDSLSPNLLGHGDNGVSERTHTVNPASIDQSKLIGDRLSNLVKNYCGDGDLILIATCSSADSINPSILNSSETPLIHTKVPTLSAEDRSDLLVEMIRRYNPRSCSNFDRTDISRRTDGFIPRDLEKLSIRALRSFAMNLSPTTLQDSLVAGLADFTPAAQISNVKDQNPFQASWADVGGLFDVKEMLQSIVRHPLLYQRIYTRARMKLPRGILL